VILEAQMAGFVSVSYIL